jgi:hypothetical protein
MPDLVDLRELKGLVGTINLTGSVTEEFSKCWSDMRSWNDRNGFVNLEYVTFPAQLVEQGRDNAIDHAKKCDYDFCLQVDADATFNETALAQILETAFHKLSQSDAVGGYCQLKSTPPIPTIDTGTGTWEVHYPNSGIMPVIRTGGHFLLIKKSAWRRFGPPWFRTRRTVPPAQAMAEVDNFARCHFDGKNELTESAFWATLMTEAIGASDSENGIGEDSGFCDALKAAGGEIFVDTSIVTGHVGRKVITDADLKEHMNKHEQKMRLTCGVME